MNYELIFVKLHISENLLHDNNKIRIIMSSYNKIRIK